MGNRLRGFGVLAAASMLAGCGGQETYAPGAETATDTMFQEACAHCHGADGAGKFGFLLGIRDTSMARAEIEALIAGGKGIMPAFPNLSRNQRRRLATYTRGL